MMSQLFLIVVVYQIVRVGTGTGLHKHGYEVHLHFLCGVVTIFGCSGAFLAFWFCAMMSQRPISCPSFWFRNSPKNQNFILILGQWDSKY